MHAIGSPEGVTLHEFEPERQEEQQAAQEQEVPAEGGVNIEDLPKCPDHQTSSCLKFQALKHSKPSMFSKYQLEFFYFDALSTKG